MFLYHCTQAGLDMAIVNSEMMQRYASIPEEERKLSEDLIWNRGEDPVAAFAAHFRDRAPRATAEERLALPLDETPGAVHHRRQQGGPGRRPGPGIAGTGTAGDHQRATDGRDGRSRAPVQREPAHRRRGVAERGGHEIRGGPPGTAHGAQLMPRRGGVSCWRR